MYSYLEEFGTLEEAYNRYCELWSCGSCLIGREASKVGQYYSCVEYIRDHPDEAEEYLLKMEGWGKDV